MISYLYGEIKRGIDGNYYIPNMGKPVDQVHSYNASAWNSNATLIDTSYRLTSALPTQVFKIFDAALAADNILNRSVGNKDYELKDHLSNVRATISDAKIIVDSDNSSTVSSADNFVPEVLSYSDMYPFGSPMPGRQYTSSNYRYGFNGQEKDDEVKGTGNSLDFGNRQYDSRIGKWLSLDPLQKKYAGHSPYNFCANNPILFVDVDGKDWFVNNKTGMVVFIKNAREITKEVLTDLSVNGDPNDYERLGPNEMFGNKVADAYGQNILKKDAVFFENSENFMKKQGYDKAEKVTIEETEFVSGGRMGPDENITQTIDDLKQIGDSKITYTKPEDLNKKEVLEKTNAQSRWSSSKSILYKLIKPFGQDNRKTAEYYGNRSKDVGRNATIVSKIFEIGKSVYKALKK